MLRAGRTASLLILVAIGVTALVACGASSDSQNGTRAAEKRIERADCSPTPARSNPDISRHLEERASVETTIAGTDVRFRVTQSNLRSSIAGHFGVDEQFTPAKGSRFLSVTYSIENRGHTGLTPARTLNERALVADSEGGAWSNEKLASCGGPVAASLAAVQEVASPNKEIVPGQEATTVTVFVVPSDTDGFVFKLPAQGLAFDLRPEA
jgi:hypothetical protein